MQGPTVNWLMADARAAFFKAALIIFAITNSISAAAAQFSIYPISLQFAPGTRASVVGINNTDKRPIRFQLTLVEWTQNARGEDVYTPSDDLIYFPRQITVQPGERGIARVGPKHGLAANEKSYRLRVQELPEPMPDATVSTLNLTITFAIPIFLGTPEPAPKADIAPLHLQQGQLTATVRNSGSAHFRIESLEVQGSSGYTEKLGGWYLLPDASREYVFAIPPEICKAQQHLQVHVKVGEKLFNSTLDVDPTLCGV